MILYMKENFLMENIQEMEYNMDIKNEKNIKGNLKMDKDMD